MPQFNVILAGCGGMAHTWMAYLTGREDVRVLGLCDIIADKAREMAREFRVDCAVFDNIHGALAGCPAANLLADCTSPDAHELIVTSGLRAGLNVLGEKPMAETRGQALREIAAADGCGRRYAVMQNRIYLPGMRTIRAAIEAGTIGRLGSVSSDFFIGAHFGGFRDLMDNVLILDMAIHTFYQARFLIGSDPVSVYCQEFSPPGSWYRGNAAAVAVFEFENGVVYDYRGSWCAEGFNTSWECGWRLVGDRGTIRWDGANPPRAQIRREGETGFLIPADEISLPDVYDRPRQGHEGCLDEMFRALAEDRPAETDCHDNYFAMNMVYGAIESARTGRKVALG